MSTLRRLLLILAVFALTLPAADLTGKWPGSIEVKKDGETKTEPAFIILKQDGTTLTGSGGPDERKQHPIQNGKVEGDKLTFEIPLGENGERVMHFNLTSSGDKIQGEVSGPAKDGGTDSAKLSFQRVKES